MNEDYKELEQWERELRLLGEPYGTPEPDARYFANFRARVMERVAEPQPAGFGSRMSELFFGSPMRMAIVGGSLLMAILSFFYLQSPTDAPAPMVQDAPKLDHQRTMPQEPVAPSVTAPLVEQPAVVEAPKATPVQPERKAVVRNQQQMPEPNVPVVEQAPVMDVATEFEKIDELSLSDETEPVSYDRLSVDELEAILKTLESEPMTIQ